MHDKEIKRLSHPEGVTYVNGLGFIQTNSPDSHMEQIRRYSSFIFFALIIYFFCEQTFYIPATNLASLLGLDVSINSHTGMIITSPISTIIISFFVKASAIVVSILIVYFTCAKDIKSNQLFVRPAYGITSIAVPIIISMSILGEFFNSILYQGANSLGIIFPQNTSLVLNKDIQLSIVLFATALLFSLLEEVFFRGIILYSLRRFGDGFAIIASSIVYALFMQGNIVWAFFISLAMGYFVIRSGSVLVALISRIGILIFAEIVSISMIYLESELAFVIKSILSLTIIGIAAIAYIYFSKRDENAFILKKSTINISLRRRIVSFSTSAVFILFTIFIVIKTINNLQIIG